MSTPTVYVVAYAERFSTSFEGIFSTREKAQVFLDKCKSLEVPEVAKNYEIQEWQLDEMEDAFVQHSAIASRSRETGEIVFNSLGEGALSAKLDEPEYLTYTDGSKAIIAHGTDEGQALELTRAAVAEIGAEYFPA